MIAVAQRVSRASVRVEEGPGAPHDERIGTGIVILLGVERGDGEAEAAWMASKIAGLRIFPDDDGRMNRSVLDIGAEVLVISQFTLLGDTSKGTRPSFTRAADPESASALVDHVAQLLRASHGLRVREGVFSAAMRVDLLNEGPVTLILERRAADAGP
ncbi:MAG: D-tyrosyl-tRNA(Tyr) deacylase [Phycisphaeraceae bacterium]|nr:MAG: D-tyrosyl-tRNA(Tyr) deacylase [Phycisphaeraceae bacterium]